MLSKGGQAAALPNPGARHLTTSRYQPSGRVSSFSDNTIPSSSA